MASEDRSSGVPPGSSLSTASYAAAMANLAGYPYPPGQVNAASTSYLNVGNYPTGYAQYNAALAAGYWPGNVAAAGAPMQVKENISTVQLANLKPKNVSPPRQQQQQSSQSTLLPNQLSQSSLNQSS